ncbi:hypothetical protein PV10_03949 [Exophiala mesophila]|uniref:Ceramide glucosyltransferase n=1 Tax=Exophiala mesophila TaxID=212818 RepID=A0A0D1XWS4_EXOME|nr:uncharacterized protein PV10_03949 [Exophiala mesophila]KIV92676.1 hypothetical protein PV10_03949 [Exophiala mesophila]
MFTEVLAVVAIAWAFFIACVCAIGDFFLFRYYRSVPPRAAVLSKPVEEIPHVTVLRPCKGLEPYLYECLASTFSQNYPRTKLSVYFCVSSRQDPAYPVIQRVVRDHSGYDAHVFVEEEDDTSPDQQHIRVHLGPNPKIRNMSRAYREAKGDLIWIIDCNVWVDRGVCGQMVDRLCGFTAPGQSPARPFKLVHHLPISIDVEATSNDREASRFSHDTPTTPLISSSTHSSGQISALLRHGGRLEELFLSSSHAKMYVAINAVAVAPCIVGKSNMFRKSHLDYLTSQAARHQDPSVDAVTISARTGIDYFSHNICEDHLIGDLLWKSPSSRVPGLPTKIRNHGLVYGDLAIQPVSGMTVGNYIARRVRWLRVRKFTVPVATLVEPGTESFLCSAYGAWGLTTSSYTRDIFGHTWAWFLVWISIILVGWASVDRCVYILLHSGRTLDFQQQQLDRGNLHDSGSMEDQPVPRIPFFARPAGDGGPRRPFSSWLLAWLGRESLALLIWTWAIWGGVTVTWRERRFWVGIDMKVHEIHDKDDRMNKGEGPLDGRSERLDSANTSSRSSSIETGVRGGIEDQRVH